MLNSVHRLADRPALVGYRGKVNLNGAFSVGSGKENHPGYMTGQGSYEHARPQISINPNCRSD